MFSRLVLPILLCLSAGLLAAQSDDPLTVGVTASPPFSYEEDGEWTGISVELWAALAEDLGVDYEIRALSLSGALEGLTRGDIDVVAAALVTTAGREERMDFSTTFYSSGLSVATAAERQSMALGILGALFKLETLLAMGALGLVLFGVGLVIWVAERRRNPEQFGGTTAEGIGSGFWWSAVTMTTVGYGDKAPLSLPGRIVGLVWMFASIIVISGFTGAIASALTVSSLQPRIESLDDLYRAQVGVIEGSSAAAFLAQQGIRAQTFADTESGLAAAAAGRIDGFVNDAPVLRYFVGRDYPDALIVLDQTFEPGFYALGLRDDYPDQETLNRRLLHFLQTPEWEQIQRRHLGR
ncbi:MAG: transporter substrate-binding domain-containing protein [Opitutales bacterium]